MPDTATLLVFSAAALALIVVPGPAVLYIVAQSIDRGRLAGFVSALGIAVGGLVHVTAAAIGLSSLLVSSATAFAVVKYAGAAYLIGLGLYTLLVRKAEREATAPRERRLRRRFSQGVVVNVLNPKTALFFFAFLPQFVDPDKGSAALQIGVSDSYSSCSRCSATASGRSLQAPPWNGCGAAGGSSQCSDTSPDRCSSASAQ